MATHARTEFAAALNQIASEKGVDVQVVIEAIEQAALAAYRKDLSLREEEIPEDFEELLAKIDPVTGEISIMRGEDNITPPGFARIAAQTAKQVIMQRLYEAEKGAVMDEYEKKVGSVVSGTVTRQEGNTFYVDIGRAEGLMPASEQTRDEYYHQGQRLKVFIKEIREGRRGPEVIVSRSDAELVKGLFALEVPEIQSGAVEIKAIAREAGGRTKLAAISSQEGVDPVGSLVGQKGVRVQAVMQELGEEKIDIVSYSDDPARFIASALAPAKDVIVTFAEVEGEQVAKVKIADSQLSLAIGKGGQNVRLAAKLTGFKIDIEGTGEQKEDTASDQKVQANDTAAGETLADRIEAAEAQVEKEITDAVKQEAQDGADQPEPTEEEAAKAGDQALADIAEEESKKDNKEELGSQDETEDTQRGDLIGDREPSEAETAPVQTADQEENVDQDKSKDNS